MAEKSSFGKNAMIWGIYVGFTLVLYNFLIYLLGIFGNQLLGGVTYVILAVGIYLSQVNYRDRALDGFIPYGKCVSFGLAVSVFSGLFYALYSVILIKLQPAVLEKTRILAEEAMIEQGMTGEQIEMASSVMSLMRNPTVIAVSAWIGIFFVGLIISLITSALIKRTKDGYPFDETMKEGENLK